MKKKPLLTIAILNWNGKHLLKKCIQSALSQSYKPIEVILVDNGSTDSSVDFVKKNFGRKVKIIAFKENLGYSYGHNAGFQKAKGKWVALMSNDVILTKNWVSQIMKTAEMDSNVGVIGSHGYYSNLTEPVNGNYFDLVGIVAPCRNKQSTSLMTVAGGVFAVNKSYFDKVYDDDYFIYGDEGFLGMRCLLKRKTNKICTSTYYNFQGPGSEGTSKLKEKTVFLSERNNLLNFFRFLKIKTIILLLPLILLHYTMTRSFNLLLTLKWNYFVWRAKAWVWLLTHTKLINEKRRQSQCEREANSDKVLFQHFVTAPPNEFKQNRILLMLYQKYIQLIYGFI